MKKQIPLVLFLVIFLAGSVWAQTADPGRLPRWDRLKDYFQNGTMTFTYKTLTSPTITSPTITGTGSIVVSSAEVNGNLTMANDEIWANSTDGDMILIFDDNATTLGELLIQSSIDSPYVEIGRAHV